MTPHNHRSIVPGCYRCEIGQDEERRSVRDEIIERAARAMQEIPYDPVWRTPAGAANVARCVLDAVGYFELVEERDRLREAASIALAARDGSYDAALWSAMEPLRHAFSLTEETP